MIELVDVGVPNLLVILRPCFEICGKKRVREAMEILGGG